MSQGVYSTRFIATSVANVWHGFACPGGKRAVVQTVSATNISGADRKIMVSVTGAVFAGRVIPAASDHHWTDLRTVLYGGEEVAVYSDGADLHMTVSGYLFDDAAREGPPPMVQLEPPEWIATQPALAAAS